MEPEDLWGEPAGQINLLAMGVVRRGTEAGQFDMVVVGDADVVGADAFVDELERLKVVDGQFGG